MLEIKLIDGSTIKFEKEYIWTDDICKDLTKLGILTAKLMIKSKKKEDENEKLRRD